MSGEIESGHSSAVETTEIAEVSANSFERTSPNMETPEADFEDCGLRESDKTGGTPMETDAEEPDKLFGDCALTETSDSDTTENRTETPTFEETEPIRPDAPQERPIEAEEEKASDAETDQAPSPADLRTLEADNRVKLEDAKTSLREADALDKEKWEAVTREKSGTDAYRTALADYNRAHMEKQKAADLVSELEKNGQELRERLKKEHPPDTDAVFPPQKILTTEEGKVRTDDNGKVHMYKEDGQWKLKPNCEYQSRGYDYRTDEKGRIKHVEGTLRLSDAGRKSLNAKVEDMQEGDQRGHIIADRFDASNQIDNIIPQLSEVNQGHYKAFENELNNALEHHKTVEVKFDVKYEDDSKRPSELFVEYAIDGETRERVFSNKRG